MASFNRIALLLLALAANAASGDQVYVSPCDNLGATGVSISDVYLDNLYLGEAMTMKFRLNTNRPLANPELQFKIVAANHDVPCDPKTEAGSCTYSLCGPTYYEVESKICTGWGCVCPIQAGSYMDPNGIQLTLPSFDGIIGEIITKSDTSVTLRLVEDGTPVYCGTGSVRVQKRGRKRSLSELLGASKLPAHKM